MLREFKTSQKFVLILSKVQGSAQTCPVSIPKVYFALLKFKDITSTANDAEVVQRSVILSDVQVLPETPRVKEDLPRPEILPEL